MKPRQQLIVALVALLAEGVDRNRKRKGRYGRNSRVALLAEGVDRNTQTAKKTKAVNGRPPRGGRG